MSVLVTGGAGYIGGHMALGLLDAGAFAVPAVMPVPRPVLTGFTFAILYMVGPVQVILNSMAQLSRAVTAIDRVEQVGGELAASAPVAQPPLPAAEGGTWHSLELDGVTHSYHNERDGSTFTLGPVDLSFRPGEIVFITGGNGSGKTTLAKLLTGLYTPESGVVRLDGRPVDGAGVEGYHALWSTVFSDFHLFESLLGLARDTLDADARRTLEELQLDHKVTVEGGKLSTTSLSQGQRKRLALLTATLEDRPIYLFDEWAADQDPHFKSVFYHELLPRPARAREDRVRHQPRRPLLPPGRPRDQARHRPRGPRFRRRRRARRGGGSAWALGRIGVAGLTEDQRRRSINRSRRMGPSIGCRWLAHRSGRVDPARVPNQYAPDALPRTCPLNDPAGLVSCRDDE